MVIYTVFSDCHIYIGAYKNQPLALTSDNKALFYKKQGYQIVAVYA